MKQVAGWWNTVAIVGLASVLSCSTQAADDDGVANTNTEGSDDDAAPAPGEDDSSPKPSTEADDTPDDEPEGMADDEPGALDVPPSGTRDPERPGDGPSATPEPPELDDPADASDDDAPNQTPAVDEPDVPTQEPESPGEPSSPTDGGSAANGDPRRAIAGVTLVDDCEDGDQELLNEVGGVIGFWYSFDDRQECTHPDFAQGNVLTCGTSACAASGANTPTDPPPWYFDNGLSDFETRAYADYGVTAPVEGQQTENTRGVRLAGGGNTYLGVGVGFPLYNPGLMESFDLQAAGYTGLRFLARSGIPGTTIPLRVKLKDAYSEPNGELCLNRLNDCEGSTCVCCSEDEPVCDDEVLQGCHDDPLAPASDTVVTDEWQLYELPFERFQREGWGLHREGEEPPGSELVTTLAYQVQFWVPTHGTPATTPLEPFELWIDNVGFIEAPPR